MGLYIADFVCHRAKVVIEVDGARHAEPNEVEQDRKRDGWFSSRGYITLRAQNDDVLNNLHGVLEAVRQLCLDRIGIAPLPDPPPQGGRGYGGSPVVIPSPLAGEGREGGNDSGTGP
jgi:hypothetical protein